MRNRAALGVVIALLTACGRKAPSEPAGKLAVQALTPLSVDRELSVLLRSSTIREPGSTVTASERLARPHLDVRLGMTVRDEVHLEATTDFFVDVRPLYVSAVPGEAVSGALVFRDAAPSMDVVHLAHAGEGRFEELRVLRDPRAPTTATWLVRTGPAVASLSLREGVVEALDRRGVAQLRSPVPFAVDAHGVRREARVGLRQTDGGYAIDLSIEPTGLAYPIVVDPGWLPTGGLATGRRLFGTATLPSGRVIVVGGTTSTTVGTTSCGSSGALSSTEIYDPASGAWTLGPSLSALRCNPGVAVSGNKLLVAGGHTGSGQLSTVDVFDFSSGTGVAVGSVPAMLKIRELPLVAPLTGTSKVLVAGGSYSSSNHSDGEVYDLSATPPTKTTVANTASVGLVGAAAVVTKGVASGDAQVLLLAGQTNATYLYDLSANTFGAVGPLSVVRCGAAVTTLPSGNVLVAGGSTSSCSNNALVTTAEVYDGVTKTFTATAGSLPSGRFYAGAGMVGGSPGFAVIAGGWSGPPSYLVMNDVQRFDEGTGLFSSYGALSIARGQAGVVGLGDGSVLTFAGAVGTSGLYATQNLASAERSGTAKTAAATCGGNGECGSGFCVDGVCCDTACTGTCQACNEPGSVGTCITIKGAPRGTRTSTCNGGSIGDPKCGYQCDGTSSTCSLATTSTVCAPATCTLGGLYTAPATCPGGGAACGTPTTTNCAPFGCSTAGCKTTCASDTDCASTAYCDTSTCKPKLDDGQAAKTANQCKSGFVADGVCCKTACTGACTSCALAGTAGTCTNVVDGNVDPHGVCPAGACSSCTAGACSVKSKGTACGVDGCAAGVLTTAGTCDGTAATCPGATTAACPNGLACKDDKSCKTACATSADCAIGACDAASGSCIGAADAGAPDVGSAETIAPATETPKVTQPFKLCTKDSECDTAHCVDGVCCDTACTERCYSCALPGSPGKCTPDPLGTDLRNDCGPTLSCVATCDGTGQCIGAGKGTTCARNHCTTATAGLGPAYCPGKGGTCEVNAAVPFECAPFVCEPAFGACATSCASSNQCANGYVCDLASKSCIAAAPAPADDSGCAYGRARELSVAWLAALSAVMLVRRRRR